MARRLRSTSTAAALCVCLLAGFARPAIEPDPGVAALIETITADSLLARVEKLVSFGIREWNLTPARLAQDYIRETFEGFALDEVSIHCFADGSCNVIGVLRGAERPERVHVIGGHYDSTGGPGADDNASGSAAVIEIARAIAGSGLRPAETVFFVAFSAEESSRLGSRAYVERLKEEGVQVIDMICLDVIGYLKPGTTADLSVSSSAFTTEINALIAGLGEVAAAYLPDWRYEGGPGCG